jgi:hypothetical protein
VDLFSRDDAAANDDRGGSNAWMTAGLIAGDPHRMLELPGIYYQVQLASPEFDEPRPARLVRPTTAGVDRWPATYGISPTGLAADGLSPSARRASRDIHISTISFPCGPPVS